MRLCSLQKQSGGNVCLTHFSEKNHVIIVSCVLKSGWKFTRHIFFIINLILKVYSLKFVFSDQNPLHIRRRLCSVVFTKYFKILYISYIKCDLFDNLQCYDFCIQALSTYDDYFSECSTEKYLILRKNNKSKYHEMLLKCFWSLLNFLDYQVH